MNWLDIVILVVIALGAFRGMSVGIIGAAIVAAGGFVGWMLAGQLSDDIGGMFDDLSNDTLVTTVSYVVIIAAAIGVALVSLGHVLNLRSSRDHRHGIVLRERR